MLVKLHKEQAAPKARNFLLTIWRTSHIPSFESIHLPKIGAKKMIQKRTFPCKKWGRQCIQTTEASSKQNRNNRNERPIPLLCGPHYWYSNIWEPAFAQSNFLHEVLQCCDTEDPISVDELQETNVWSINHHVHNQKWNKKETKTQSTRNIDHCSVLPASSISPKEKSSTKLSLGI